MVWVGALFPFVFWHCQLGEGKGIWSLKYCRLSPKVIFLNQQSKKTDED